MFQQLFKNKILKHKLLKHEIEKSNSLMNKATTLLATTLLASFTIMGCSGSNSLAHKNIELQKNTLLEKTIETQSCITPISSRYVNAVLTHKNQGWDECFDHNAQGLFSRVIFEINELAETLLESETQPTSTYERLDDLLYYLRAFSYFGDRSQLKASDWQQLNSSLALIVKLTRVSSTQNKRLQEHVLVTLYRYYYQDELQNQLADFVPFITQLLADYTPPSKIMLPSATIQTQYTLWELYRTLGFLAYESRSKPILKNALLGSSSVDNPVIENSMLLEKTTQHLSSLKENDWRFEHSVWVLAQLHILLDEDKAEALDLQMQKLLFENDLLTNQQAKELFSQMYLANSFRSKSACEEDFIGMCLIPTIDDVLPINHTCSSSLFIRASKMTAEQLQSTCKKLIAQEQFFHQTLATNKQAVANDFNQSLRVVIFNNYSEYNRFGELVFDINTNNGGMYIEGTPSSPKNQATFFSFEAFWSQPAFKVWNLNHEYVHYLDGRFVKYGTFGHFPSHLVWWSEGIAEYISKGNHNPKVEKLLMDTTQDKWPNLQDIFATTYNDGSKRVYQWSYLAQLFIFSLYPEQGQQLAHYLKTDYFEGYKALLDEFAIKHQQEFELWLHQQLKMANNKSTDVTLSKGKVLKNKAHGIYRYLYRDYLYPQHLPKTDRHNHISNFG